jgi:hypothetical protein
MSLSNIYKDGALVNVLTTKDEMQMQIGVGTDFLFTLSHPFYKN